MTCSCLPFRFQLTRARNPPRTTRLQPPAPRQLQRRRRTAPVCLQRCAPRSAGAARRSPRQPDRPPAGRRGSPQRAPGTTPRLATLQPRRQATRLAVVRWRLVLGMHAWPAPVSAARRLAPPPPACRAEGAPQRRARSLLSLLLAAGRQPPQAAGTAQRSHLATSLRSPSHGGCTCRAQTAMAELQQLGDAHAKCAAWTRQLACTAHAEKGRARPAYLPTVSIHVMVSRAQREGGGA